ncbi:MAG: RNA polymerase sigma factor [Alkalispirochaeta sp.]
MALDIETLYRTYGPMVMRRCRSILKDEDAAADAMQDTFLKVIRYQDRLNGRAPSSLLYTIATNVCLNRLRASRRNRVDVVGNSIDRVCTEDDHTERILDRTLAESIFSGVGAPLRRTATDYYVRGKTLVETASREGLSVSGVRRRLARFGEHARRVTAA